MGFIETVTTAGKWAYVVMIAILAIVAYVIISYVQAHPANLTLV